MEETSKDCDVAHEEQSHVSSVTELHNVDLYPPSGTMYPSLESVDDGEEKEDQDAEINTGASEKEAVRVAAMMDACDDTAPKDPSQTAMVQKQHQSKETMAKPHSGGMTKNAISQEDNQTKVVQESSMAPSQQHNSEMPYDPFTIEQIMALPQEEDQQQAQPGARSVASLNASAPGAFLVTGTGGTPRTSSREEADSTAMGHNEPPRQEQSAYPTHVPPTSLHHDIEAVVVEEEVERAQIEEEIRKKVLEEAVQADVVTNHGSHKRWMALALVTLVIALSLAIGLASSLSSKSNDDTENDKNNDDDDNEMLIDERPTLEIVRERGYVKCGMDEGAFVSIDEDTKEISGFNVEQCQAVALLALGDSTKFEPFWVTSTTRFLFLQNRTVDLLTEGTTHTMGRDVHEGSSQTGFTFTTPYVYAGLVFAGTANFVDCAENYDSFNGVCRDLKVCVAEGTTHINIVYDTLPGSVIAPFTGTPELIANLESGKCNAFATEPPFPPQAKELYGRSEDFKVGAKFFSKEPLALVTRSNDPEWSFLVDLVVHAFTLAEAHNISKLNAEEMANLFVENSTISESNVLHGVQKNSEGIGNISPLLVSMIAEFGNHGDRYAEHIESLIPRQYGLNSVYDKSQSSGLLYAIPFGKVEEPGPGPVLNGTLDTVLRRGYLRCGVLPSRGPGFVSNPAAEATNLAWTGFDVEFCRGLAASLFAGDKTKIVFVELQDAVESYFALSNTTVDVVGGARVTLQAGCNEPNTGHGFTFSSPYYYDNERNDAFAFLTRQEDSQWSDFVYWMVMAVVYAEEEGITKQDSSSMPVVTLFGEHLKQCLRDCISALGSYKELYLGTLQAFVPRSGANTLNEGLAWPQMFPIPPV